MRRTGFFQCPGECRADWENGTACLCPHVSKTCGKSWISQSPYLPHLHTPSPPLSPHPHPHPHIRLTSLALWQSNDCPSASKTTLMNMDKYFMWIHYERLHNHNKAKHNKTVCIFLGIYCISCCRTKSENIGKRCPFCIFVKSLQHTWSHSSLKFYGTCTQAPYGLTSASRVACLAYFLQAQF